MKLHRFFKHISLCLSMCLFWQAAFAHVPQLNIWKERTVSTIPNTYTSTIPTSPEFPSLLAKQSLAHPTNLPSGILKNMSIKEMEIEEGQPIVFIIQDIHLHKEAQLHTSESIKRFVRQSKDSGEPVVFGVEATVGEFDYTPYRDNRFKAETKHVADELLQEGRIGAVAHAGLTMTPDELKHFNALGVENSNNYADNVKAYRDAHKLKVKIKNQIQKLEKKISKQAPRVLRPKVLRYFNLKKQYALGNISLGSYVESLTNEFDFYDIPIQLSSFLAAFEMEKTLDFNQAEQEREIVLEKLAKTVPHQDLMVLMAYATAFQQGERSLSDYYQALRSIATKNNFGIKHYPAFDDYIRYLSLSLNIKVEQLFQDVKSTEDSILQVLNPTSEEKTILDQSHMISLTKDLLDFSLTPSKWQDYLQIKKQQSRLDESVYPNKNDLLPFENFYKLADQRNFDFVKNLSGHPKSVLITGGFHTPGLKQLFKTKNHSYVVLSPRVTKVDLNEGSNYLRHFLEEKNPIQRIFKGRKLFLGLTEIAGATQPQRMDVVPSLRKFVNKIYSKRLSALTNNQAHVAMPNTIAWFWDSVNNDRRFNIKFLGPLESLLMAFVIGFLSIWAKLVTGHIWLEFLAVGVAGLVGYSWGQLHRYGSYVFRNGAYEIHGEEDPYVRRSANLKSFFGALWLSVYALAFVSGAIVEDTRVQILTLHFTSVVVKFAFLAFLFAMIPFVLHVAKNWSQVNDEDKPSRAIGTYSENYDNGPIFFGTDSFAFNYDMDEIVVTNHLHPGLRRTFTMGESIGAVGMDYQERYVAGLDSITGQFQIWNIYNRSSIPIFSIDEGVNAFAFHPRKKQFTVGDQNGIIRNFLISDQGAHLIGELKGHTAAIASISYNKNGRKLISTDQNGTVVVWDLQHRHALWSRGFEVNEAIMEPADNIRAGFVDSRQIIYVQVNDEVELLDSRNGHLLSKIPISGANTDIVNVVAHPKKPILAVTYNVSIEHAVSQADVTPDQTPYERSVRQGEKLIEMEDENPSSVAFYDISNPQEIQVFDLWVPAYQGVFSPNGKHFIFSDGSGEIKKAPIKYMAFLPRFNLNLNDIYFRFILFFSFFPPFNRILRSIEINELNKVIDFLIHPLTYQEHPPTQADFAVNLGNDDIRVWETAANLVNQDIVDEIFLVGGRGTMTDPLIKNIEETGFVISEDPEELKTISEAEITFRYMTRRHGVDPEKTRLEKNSKNLPENLINLLKELNKLREDPDKRFSLILMHTPLYHARLEATARKYLTGQGIDYSLLSSYTPPAKDNPTDNDWDRIKKMALNEIQKLSNYHIKGDIEETILPLEVARAVSILRLIDRNEKVVFRFSPNTVAWLWKLIFQNRFLPEKWKKSDAWIIENASPVGSLIMATLVGLLVIAGLILNWPILLILFIGVPVSSAWGLSHIFQSFVAATERNSRDIKTANILSLKYGHQIWIQVSFRIFVGITWLSLMVIFLLALSQSFKFDLSGLANRPFLILTPHFSFLVLSALSIPLLFGTFAMGIHRQINKNWLKEFAPHLSVREDHQAPSVPLALWNRFIARKSSDSHLVLYSQLDIFLWTISLVALSKLFFPELLFSFKPILIALPIGTFRGLLHFLGSPVRNHHSIVDTKEFKSGRGTTVWKVAFVQSLNSFFIFSFFLILAVSRGTKFSFIALIFFTAMVGLFRLEFIANQNNANSSNTVSDNGIELGNLSKPKKSAQDSEYQDPVQQISHESLWEGHEDIDKEISEELRESDPILAELDEEFRKNNQINNQGDEIDLVFGDQSTDQHHFSESDFLPLENHEVDLHMVEDFANGISIGVNRDSSVIHMFDHKKGDKTHLLTPTASYQLTDDGSKIKKIAASHWNNIFFLMDDGSIRYINYDLTRNRFAESKPIPLNNLKQDEQVTDIAIFPQGARLLIIATSQGNLVIHNSTPRNHLGWSFKKKTVGNVINVIQEEPINKIVFSGRGSRLFVYGGSRNNQLHIYNTNNYLKNIAIEGMRRLTNLDAPYRDFISPGNGHYLIGIVDQKNEEPTIHVWEYQEISDSYKPKVYRLKHPTHEFSPITMGRFTHETQLLVLLGENGDVTLHDFEALLKTRDPDKTLVLNKWAHAEKQNNNFFLRFGMGEKEVTILSSIGRISRWKIPSLDHLKNQSIRYTTGAIPAHVLEPILKYMNPMARQGRRLNHMQNISPEVEFNSHSFLYFGEAVAAFFSYFMLVSSQTLQDYSSYSINLMLIFAGLILAYALFRLIDDLKAKYIRQGETITIVGFKYKTQKYWWRHALYSFFWRIGWQTIFFFILVGPALGIGLFVPGKILKLILFFLHVVALFSSIFIVKSLIFIPFQLRDKFFVGNNLIKEFSKYSPNVLWTGIVGLAILVGSFKTTEASSLPQNNPIPISSQIEKNHISENIDLPKEASSIGLSDLGTADFIQKSVAGIPDHALTVAEINNTSDFDHLKSIQDNFSLDHSIIVVVRDNLFPELKTWSHNKSYALSIIGRPAQGAINMAQIIEDTVINDRKRFASARQALKNRSLKINLYQKTSQWQTSATIQIGLNAIPIKDLDVRVYLSSALKKMFQSFQDSRESLSEFFSRVQKEIRLSQQSA